MSKIGSPSDKRRRVESPEKEPAKPATKKPAARKTPAKPDAAPAPASAKPAAAPKKPPVKKAPTKKKPARKRAAAKKAPRKIGRPSLYTQAVVDAILEKIAGGKFLSEICDDPAMPSCSTVFKWRVDHPEFSEAYTHAREAAADKLQIETIQIADDGRNDTYVDEEGQRRTDYDVIQRSKLRVETRKWLLAKMAPKTFGDRVALDHSGEIKKTSELTDEELDAAIAARQAVLQDDGE